jgi:hypothetical protein
VSEREISKVAPVLSTRREGYFFVCLYFYRMNGIYIYIAIGKKKSLDFPSKLFISQIEMSIE